MKMSGVKQLISNNSLARLLLFNNANSLNTKKCADLLSFNEGIHVLHKLVVVSPILFIIIYAVCSQDVFLCNNSRKSR